MERKQSIQRNHLKDILVHGHPLFEQVLVKIRTIVSIFP